MKSKKILTTLFCALPLMAAAQTFDFDMTKPQPVYNEETGYGYDLVAAPTKKTSNEPFYFSVKVDDGNYRIRVVIGSKKKAGETTVRAEGRRLMVHNVATKKGKTETFEFQVNKRSPRIDDKSRVRIKDREKDYLAWDDKLTLEFNGDAPAVQSIHIERDDQVPTVYLCGNSTVVDQNSEPWASWGQMITRWFGPEVAISNHAESGLTARTFIAGGRLDKILTTLKPGDLLIAEFGHNDEKEKRPGDGAWYHYVYNLKIFIDQVRSKGADIVFCTPTQRRAFDKDKKTITNTHGEFPAAMKSVAEREKVPVIDLNVMTKQFFETLGFEDSKRALVHYPKELYGRELADNTHFNPYGAYEVAKCVVMGMKKLQLPIVRYLRPEWQDFDPTQPDDWKTFKWAPSPMKDIVKPDGN
ncbi:MAG: rhamnogalacturonan acetylesterase [Prevotella sp.]|jgi:lysophospholipase L1-like esterase|nr:rhamnogalacturonan acetylesterase [Prevotella sp.]